MRIATRSSLLWTTILFFPIALLQMPWPTSATEDTPAHNLQLSIVRDSSERRAGGPPMFRVELQNTGKDDLVLSLGMMLGNGRKQYPSAITLIIADSAGKSRIFDLRGPAFVAGRVDPFILPLPIGAKYSLPIDLNNYWSAASKEFDYKLRGAYTIEAKFTGEKVPASQDALLAPYWIGKVTSNQLSFEVAN